MADEDTTKGTDDQVLDADKGPDPDPKAQDTKGIEDKDQSQDTGTLDQQPKWVQDLVGELRKENATHRLAKKKAESEAQAAKRKVAEEEGKYKELYEAEKAGRETAEAKAKGLELDALKTKVAAAVKLPAGLAARLQGETEEELIEDAKLLAAELPKPSMETDGDKGTGGDGTPLEMTDANKQEFGNKYNVDPKYVEAASFQLPKK